MCVCDNRFQTPLNLSEHGYPPHSISTSVKQCDSVWEGQEGIIAPILRLGKVKLMYFLLHFPLNLRVLPPYPPPIYHTYIHTRLQFEICNVRAQEQHYVGSELQGNSHLRSVSQ